MKKPVIVVTGMGAVSPYGIGVPVFWEKLIDNHSAVNQVEDEFLRQWAPVGARIPDFSAEDYLDRREVRNSDRFTQLALIAAKEALSDAKLLDKDGHLSSKIDSNRFGTALGSADRKSRRLTSSTVATSNAACTC